MREAGVGLRCAAENGILESSTPAYWTQAERRKEIREEAAQREAEKRESRATLLEVMPRFTAGLVLAVGISVGGYFVLTYLPARYIRGHHYVAYLMVVGFGLAAALVSLLVWNPRLFKDLRYFLILWAIAWVVLTLMVWFGIATYMLHTSPNPG